MVDNYSLSLNKEQNVKVCRASKADRCKSVWFIILVHNFLFSLQPKENDVKYFDHRR